MPHTTINGYRHFYEDLGSGEPVVLLHGITNSSYYFRRLIPGIAAEFHVIAPHFRGMGFSERAVDIPPGAWLDDVMVLLDQLDIGSAHFYGVNPGRRWPKRPSPPDRTARTGQVSRSSISN